jgi:hypothetical protein
MSRSGSGKPADPVLEGCSCFSPQKSESASFGTKMALSLNGVDPGCMNPITGSTCRAKCSNILHHNNGIQHSRGKMTLCILCYAGCHNLAPMLNVIMPFSVMTPNTIQKS